MGSYNWEFCKPEGTREIVISLRVGSMSHTLKKGFPFFFFLKTPVLTGPGKGLLPLIKM